MCFTAFLFLKYSRDNIEISTFVLFSFSLSFHFYSRCFVWCGRNHTHPSIKKLHFPKRRDRRKKKKKEKTTITVRLNRKENGNTVVLSSYDKQLNSNTHARQASNCHIQDCRLGWFPQDFSLSIKLVSHHKFSF